jgi:hypothetical protein
MIQENEVIMLLLGVGVFIFMYINRRRLAGVGSYGVLFAAFVVLLAGWTFTVLEGFVLDSAFNLLEHICYAISTILLALWCAKVFKRAGAV